MDAEGTNKEVGECAPIFSPDELPGFEKTTRKLPPEDDGELVATLIRTTHNGDDLRPAVLYVHGFVDYFFQAHVARAFEEAGFRFYALDLRRSGRSWREGNRPFFAHSVEEYFVDLDFAFDVIKKSHPRVSALIAHSTGGLICSLFLNARKGQEPCERLILNSPFLRFNLRPFRRVLATLVAGVARFNPYFELPQRMPSTYGKTIHVTCGGEWDYDLKKKPLDGFSLYPGWFRMIRQAHAEVVRGLDIRIPILSLFSDKSERAGNDPVEADRKADVVLDVRDMKRLSARLGKDVTLFEVPDGMHDLTLSCEKARTLAIRKMIEFALGSPRTAL